ncbi:MAG: hypothetical protein B6242_15695 [Anaerolineaceae bacterium 4572_78]|nr:MAG: hypothetical protein B6242_15695 [Anaerolineaceae bacterium 4572_78]
MLQKLKNNSSKIVSIGLVAFGVILITYFGLRFVRSFVRLQTQGLQPGITDVSAIRPWMTVRYIAIAYAVPEEYILYELNIPYDRRNLDRDLVELNLRFDFGEWEKSSGNPPPVVRAVQEAIEAYQQTPVATGIDEIDKWMTVHYISNAAGVPQEYIFEKIGIPAEGNEDVFLHDLRKIYHGDIRFEEAIYKAIDEYHIENPTTTEVEDG